MFKDPEVKESKFFVPLIIVFLSFYLISGCGGGNGTGDGGDNPGVRTRVVTGAVSAGTANNISPTIHKEKLFSTYIFRSLFTSIATTSALAAGQAGTFTVTAVARDGSVHEIDTDSMTGEFMMELPVEECYTMSFTAHTGQEMMDEFLGFMALDCGPGHMGEFDDQFCLSDGGGPVDLGIITVNSDHSFSSPMNNPLEDVDFDGDGMMDFQDPDYICGNVGDDNQDGYYDDDMNHDGFHDDDMNSDGFHDDDMNHDGFHDGGDMGRPDPSHDGPGGGMGGGMM